MSTPQQPVDTKQSIEEPIEEPVDKKQSIEEPVDKKQSIESILSSLAAKYRGVADLMAGAASEFEELRDSFSLLVPSVINMAAAQRSMAVTQNTLVAHMRKMQAAASGPLPEIQEEVQGGENVASAK